jgi:hypothetical protein
MHIAVLSLSLAVVAAPLAAQEQELVRPAHWKVRFDRPGTPDTAVYFVGMPPGWHITTGPAAILYDPASTASGAFRIQSTIFLFDPGQRHREAYGILLGGRDLDGPDQSYVYFLIRDTGEFLLKRRDGGSTSVIRDWAPSPAIVRHAGGEENAKNVLAVEAQPNEVVFMINGQTVATVPRSEIQADGIVGLRVNHGLNLHVSELAVMPSGG